MVTVPTACSYRIFEATFASQGEEDRKTFGPLPFPLPFPLLRLSHYGAAEAVGDLRYITPGFTCGTLHTSYQVYTEVFMIGLRIYESTHRSSEWRSDKPPVLGRSWLHALGRSN